MGARVPRPAAPTRPATQNGFLRTRVRCFSPGGSRHSETLALAFIEARSRRKMAPFRNGANGRKSTFVDVLPTDETRECSGPLPGVSFRTTGSMAAYSELLHCPGPRQAAGVSKNVHCPDRAVGRSAPRFYGGIERVIHWPTEEL